MSVGGVWDILAKRLAARYWCRAASMPLLPEPPKVSEFEAFDISYAELANFGGFFPAPGSQEFGGWVGDLIRRLGQDWLVGDPRRAKDIRIGTMYVWVDADDQVHFDFVPRNPYVLWDRDAKRWKVQFADGQVKG